MDSASLQQKLMQIDGRGYKTYGDPGAYRFPRFMLFVDYVQGDPSPPPSRLRAGAQADAGFDARLFENQARRVASRTLLPAPFSGDRPNSPGKSRYGQVRLGGAGAAGTRTALVTDRFVEVRFVAGLPADGACLGRGLWPCCWTSCRGWWTPLFLEALDRAPCLDTSRLPRIRNVCGDNSRRNIWSLSWPTAPSCPGRAVSATGLWLLEMWSASSHRLSCDLNYSCPIAVACAAWASPRSLLIVGGGYHGKSTLLSALERGVYSHIPGDGRELVACRDDAVKIRAEDAGGWRRWTPALHKQPALRNRHGVICTEMPAATSQAPNIAEALEVGSRCCWSTRTPRRPTS